MDASARVAGKKSDSRFLASGRVGVIRAIEGAGQLAFIVLESDRHVASKQLVRGEDGIGFDHVGVDEEILQAAFSENLLDTRTQERAARAAAIE